MSDAVLLLTLAFFAAALLYSCVGHGGASAYLAVMVWASFTPEMMRPCALWMNVSVSLLATFLFFRAGHFRWRLFWPFAVTAIPLAWLGGTVSLAPGGFHLLVGAALLVAAVRFFLPIGEKEPRPFSLIVAVCAGGIMGFISGLVGVGGGIFLTPLLLLAGWARAKEAAAVSAPFILVNSLAGLSGLAKSGHHPVLPEAFPLWLAAAVLGGLLGASWGSRVARPDWLRKVLGLVLVAAAVKFGKQGFA
jgi:uncharacterized membrane protein YfcA